MEISKTINEVKYRMSSILSDDKELWSANLLLLNTEERLSYNPMIMKSASLIKLFVMAAVFDGIEKGQVKETSEISEWMKEMVVVSHNEATNCLVRALSPSEDFKEGAEKVNDWMREQGFVDTHIGRRLGYFENNPEGENYTRPEEVVDLVKRIYDGTLVSQTQSKKMEALMLQQEFRDKIPKYLDGSIKIGNKTGELPGVEHDVAIVYGENPFILCIMSSDVADEKQAADRIGKTALSVYEAIYNIE